MGLSVMQLWACKRYDGVEVRGREKGGGEEGRKGEGRRGAGKGGLLLYNHLH